MVSKKEKHIRLLETLVKEKDTLITVMRYKILDKNFTDENFLELFEQQKYVIDDVERKLLLYSVSKIFKPKKILIGNLTRGEYGMLTRLLFDSVLPKSCELCGSTENLHIHHKVYALPILREHLQRLCQPCHSKIPKRNSVKN